MSTTKVTIFLAGATGYIGGSILQRLLAHPNKQNFEITALVRSADKAKRLESEFGVKTVIGSLQDLDKLEALAENAHVVIQAADCDDVNATNAILRGLKARHEKTGDVPIMIHNSGTGELMDDAQGAFKSDRVYSDLNIADIEALPPTAIHRPVDVLVVAADAAGYARTHIIMPSVIYGVATGPLFDAGIANAHTLVFPLYVRAALHHKHLAMLNEGATCWANVHISDITDLFIRMLDTILSNPEKVSHGREGYFFGANEEFSGREGVQAVSDALFALGRIPSPEVVKYSLDGLAKYYASILPPSFGSHGGQFVARALFSNTRCTGDRARRELGWAPAHTTKDMFEGLKSEVEILVKKIEAEKSA
ncbi:NAD-P-binding protein [Trametes versicolor FP-101664 SS1]|uniref:NAD-P-binding protein n=1 Tax=Trametes versicolor (strain FP-101664) TaxID=717944 RepID=UPI0004624953|nr:NAD-P-binding protein [Trametes versicolor FP-101664 SS1]EIW52407.1 NAD-P-binding protein [Trametes versicolor FP-101664 SS1]